MDAQNRGKQAAAFQAVDDWLENNQAVGIGSGSTIKFAVDRIAARCQKENLTISCVPTSFQAKQLILENKLQLATLEQCPELDVAFDGADEVDRDLSLIKGGGGCLLQEKIVSSCAKKFVIVADDRKDSLKLGESWDRGVPLEVVPMAYVAIQRRIEREFGGKVLLREAVKKMGPVVTDNGNFLMDWVFDTSKDYNWRDVDSKLHMMPGIVETGLFINMACKAYFGTAEGSVITRESNHSIKNGK